MKNKTRKALRTKLLAEIEAVIKRNKVNLSNKIEKVLKKSIRKIVKKVDIEKISGSTEKSKPVSYSNKSKMDGVPIATSRHTTN